MKAAILKKYAKQGTECVLMDIPTPEPGAGVALIRITAAGVNPLDNMIIRGEVKLIVPYRTPLVRDGLLLEGIYGSREPSKLACLAEMQ